MKNKMLKKVVAGSVAFSLCFSSLVGSPAQASLFSDLGIFRAIGSAINAFREFKMPAAAELAELKVGDRVRYVPNGSEVILNGETGIKTEQRINPSDKTDWIVFNIDGDKVELINVGSVGSLQLKGKAGYDNASDIFNRISKEFGENARVANEEDISKIVTKDFTSIWLDNYIEDSLGIWNFYSISSLISAGEVDKAKVYAESENGTVQETSFEKELKVIVTLDANDIESTTPSTTPTPIIENNENWTFGVVTRIFEEDEDEEDDDLYYKKASILLADGTTSRTYTFKYDAEEDKAADWKNVDDLENRFIVFNADANGYIELDDYEIVAMDTATIADGDYETELVIAGTATDDEHQRIDGKVFANSTVVFNLGCDTVTGKYDPVTSKNWDSLLNNDKTLRQDTLLVYEKDSKTLSYVLIKEDNYIISDAEYAIIYTDDYKEKDGSTTKKYVDLLLAGNSDAEKVEVKDVNIDYANGLEEMLIEYQLSGSKINSVKKLIDLPTFNRLKESEEIKEVVNETAETILAVNIENAIKANFRVVDTQKLLIKYENDEDSVKSSFGELMLDEDTVIYDTRNGQIEKTTFAALREEVTNNVFTYVIPYKNSKCDIGVDANILIIVGVRSENITIPELALTDIENGGKIDLGENWDKYQVSYNYNMKDGNKVSNYWYSATSIILTEQKAYCPDGNGWSNVATTVNVKYNDEVKSVRIRPDTPELEVDKINGIVKVPKEDIDNYEFVDGTGYDKNLGDYFKDELDGKVDIYSYANKDKILKLRLKATDKLLASQPFAIDMFNGKVVSMSELKQDTSGYDYRNIIINDVDTGKNIELFVTNRDNSDKYLAVNGEGKCLAQLDFEVNDFITAYKTFDEIWPKYSELGAENCHSVYVDNIVLNERNVPTFEIKNGVLDLGEDYEKYSVDLKARRWYSATTYQKIVIGKEIDFNNEYISTNKINVLNNNKVLQEIKVRENINTKDIDVDYANRKININNKEKYEYALYNSKNNGYKIFGLEWNDFNSEVLNVPDVNSGDTAIKVYIREKGSNFSNGVASIYEFYIFYKAPSIEEKIAIKYLDENNYFDYKNQGYDSNLSDKINKREVLKYACKLLGFTNDDFWEKVNITNNFTDLKKVDYDNGVFNCAIRKGIIEDKNEKSNIYDDITLETACEYLVRALGYKSESDYVAKANELGITENVVNTNEMTYGDFFIMLYNADRVKNNLNDIGLASDIKGLDCEEAVNKLLELEVISCYEDGTYRPESTMTRAEMAVTLCTMLEIDAITVEESKNVPSKFNDVAAGEWYTGYINVLEGKGLLKNFADEENFRPNDNLTMNELLTACVNALGRGEYASESGTWPANYIAEATTLGLLDGVKTSDANRGNIAMIVWNTMNSPYTWDDTSTEYEDEYVEKTEELGNVEFVDVNPGDWYYDNNVVEYAVLNGYMEGLNEKEFGPDVPMTFAMLSEVNKIDGIISMIMDNDEDECIGRSKVLEILYNYASSKGYDVSVEGNEYLSFNDSEEVDKMSTDAKNAINWAIKVGVISGDKNEVTGKINVLPAKSVTRAQFAAMLKNFNTKMIAE